MTKSPILIPGSDEFHGSSEILKISTKAITLAPALDQKDDDGRWLTYMRVVKCRFDGSRTRYVGLCCFNPRANKYEKNYALGTLNPQENKFQNLEFFKTPKWALNIATAKEETNE